jgi:Leucine-rich repeat (LRR) protein
MASAALEQHRRGGGAGGAQWTVDLSFPTRRPARAARFGVGAGADGEEERLSCVPVAVLSKYRMKRDTGSGLRELWLSGQDVSVLSQQVGQLLNLRTLGLAGNRLESLPAQLGELKRLERLVLSGNRLSGLPAELAGLHALKELRLDANALGELPGCVFRLRRLVHLSASKNRLTAVPAEIARLRQLAELDLDDNQIDDAAVKAFPWKDVSASLQVLGLNTASRLPDEIFALKHLALVRTKTRCFRPNADAAASAGSSSPK